MKIWRVLVVICLSVFLLAPFGDKNGLLMSLPYETEGQKHWFATPSGTGDCSSWNAACTFRTAVGKCTSTVFDVIHLGAGNHDTDNGVDGDGTTISVDGVRIIGLGTSRAANAKLVNGDAAAAIVLKVTGDNFNIQRVDFDNSAEADENVIYLNINAATRGLIRDCNFTQDSAAPPAGGTGILFDGASTEYYVEDCLFNYVVDDSIRTNSMTQLFTHNLFIAHGGTGVHCDGGANDEHLYFFDTHIREQTLGIDIAASTDDVSFTGIQLIANTTNVTDLGTWGGIEFINAIAGTQPVKVLPTGAGTVVATGDGAWTWTAAATTLVAADTISGPFYITNLNIQAADASQTYKVEILYGDATANTSLGIYEFYVGAALGGSFVGSFTPDIVNTLIPANSIIGLKTMSSTAGVDNATFTISYQEF
jgi:hypothetical protein